VHIYMHNFPFLATTTSSTTYHQLFKKIYLLYLFNVEKIVEDQNEEKNLKNLRKQKMILRQNQHQENEVCILVS